MNDTILRHLADKFARNGAEARGKGDELAEQARRCLDFEASVKLFHGAMLEYRAAATWHTAAADITDVLLKGK